MTDESNPKPMHAWFKLVGATDSRLAEFWAQDEPFNFTEVWFPWNKSPSNIWRPGRLILYAVGWGVLVAEQDVDGPPQIKPRPGPPGSPTNRWPRRLAVKTLYYCSPLTTAPELREHAPESPTAMRSDSGMARTGESTRMSTSCCRESSAPTASRAKRMTDRRLVRAHHSNARPSRSHRSIRGTARRRAPTARRSGPRPRTTSGIALLAALAPALACPLVRSVLADMRRACSAASEHRPARGRPDRSGRSPRSEVVGERGQDPC